MIFRKLALAVLNAGAVGAMAAIAQAAKPAIDYPIQPVPFSAVQISDRFWGPRMETNRTVTIPYDFQKCEETGRIDNFAKAGKLMPGKFRGIFFDDSDVYKVIEGAAYSLSLHPDPKLDQYLDDLIAKIAAAQQPDGYLFTFYTVNGELNKRWTNEKDMHETYCAGHLIEAAVAHHQATGKRNLLDVAIRVADHLDKVFGPDALQDPPGHQEIEIALAKLYRLTGEDRYLELAQFLIDARGCTNGRRNLYGPYSQDHKPVVDQTSPVGHAVRATYLYSGMADVAALTGNDSYVQALDRIWENTVYKKMYLTGGIGARREGEAFGEDYELPNAEAYNETCAAIAFALWNQRMFLLKGESKYIDVLERTAYNGFLAGVSLEGNRFFYPNPLECKGREPFNMGTLGRAPWFDCSCCPVNVVRFLPSLAGYVYAKREEAVYVNLFVAGGGDLQLDGRPLRLEQTTNYPWSGEVAIKVQPQESSEFELRVRIPGWALGQPVPGDLYRYQNAETPEVKLSVNGESAKIELAQGYAVLKRNWNAGDTVQLSLPMPIRRVLAHEKVEANQGRVALERGPIVYCVEGIDHGGEVRQLALLDAAELKLEEPSDALGGIRRIVSEATARRRTDDGKITDEQVKLTAIPYYAWAHRAMGEMAVWLPRRPELARIKPAPTIAGMSKASASHVYASDTPMALNDQEEPRSSSDGNVPRLTWWDHKGTTEWAQYEFKEPTKVSEVQLYWFDDTGRGQCRLPKAWRLLYKDGEQWKSVGASGSYGVEKDKYNTVSFEPVITSALRVEVDLQANFSGGILEWKVN